MLAMFFCSVFFGTLAILGAGFWWVNIRPNRKRL